MQYIYSSAEYSPSNYKMITYDSQATRSRSRSRSRASSRRPVAKSRVQTARSMVYRSLGYNGTCSLARSVILSIPITKAAGFTISGQTFSEASFTYSPQYLRLRGDSTHELQALIPQAAELAAVWERVKIDRVELSIISNVIDEAITTSMNTPATQNAPKIVLANDFVGPNTGGSTGTLTNVLQETGATFYDAAGDQPVIRWTCRAPKYERLIAYTEAESDYEPANGFIRTDADIAHHGTRIGLANFAALAGCQMTVFAKFYFTFKNVH